MEPNSLTDIACAAPCRAETIFVDKHSAKPRITLWKKVMHDDPYMSGHFPGFTIFPGVFIIELLRESVAAALGTSDGALPSLVNIRSIRFLAPLLAGDEVSLTTTIHDAAPGEVFPVDARCERRDGTLAAELKTDFAYLAGERDAGVERA